MLQAPTTETKTQSEASRSAALPEPRHTLHPHYAVIRGLNGGSLFAGSERTTPLGLYYAGLQKTVGNQAVLRMLSSAPPALQTKLTVNEPGDKYEQEADRVADQVMRMPDSNHVPSLSPTSGGGPNLQRTCSCGGSGGECASCKGEKEEGLLQRKAEDSSAGHEAPPIVHEVLRSPGAPMDAETRAFFEPRFGRDFSSVRIHSDSRAAESAKRVNAIAYTVGQHIALGHMPHQTADARKRLLAHEIVHVIQQSPHSTSASTVPNLQSPLADASLNSNSVLARQDGDGGPDAGAGSGPTDAGAGPDPADAGANSLRNAQDECVKRLGGCPNTRPGGIPTEEEIQSYNESCRTETGYSGDDVQPTCPQAPEPGPSARVPDAWVCGRPLNYPGLSLAFNHAYVKAPPYNYAIVAPLCKPTDGGSDSLIWNGTAARKWDNSCDPGAATPECIACRPKPGVTDVKKCLRNAYTAYNSPVLHKALGPNSNTFAYTLASTCCAGITTSSPFSSGYYPGWGDPPAPARPATCSSGPPDCT